MSLSTINFWWCCASAGLKAFILLLLGRVLLFQQYITRAEYEIAVQIVAGVTEDYRMNVLPLSIGLTAGVFIDPEGNMIDVFYFDPFWWAASGVFLASPAASCLSGCSLRPFPR